MTTGLLAGAVFGLAAGFAPGPLTAFVLAQTLRHGSREGMKAAAAPLITDAPIILLSLLLVRFAVASESVLGAVSLLGAGFVAYLAWECWRAPAPTTHDEATPPRSLAKAAALNALSPHPYLFWLLVGGPQLMRAWESSATAAGTFIGGFYVCLCGAKALLALAVGLIRQRLLKKLYRTVMRGLALALLLAAGLLVRDGFRLLGS